MILQVEALVVLTSQASKHPATTAFNAAFVAKVGLAAYAIALKGVDAAEALVIADGNPDRVTGLPDPLAADILPLTLGLCGE